MKTKIDWALLYQRVKYDVGMKIVHALPKTLVYWAAIRLIVHATTGKYSSQIVPDLTAMDALKRWEQDKLK